MTTTVQSWANYSPRTAYSPPLNFTLPTRQHKDAQNAADKNVDVPLFL